MKNKKKIFIFLTILFLIVTSLFGGKQISNSIKNLLFKNSNEIGQFTLSWISGGDQNQGSIQDNGSLLIEPTENSIYNAESNPGGGIQVTYQLLFNMGGSEDAPAGAIKIFLPKHIFKDRNGNNIEEVIDVPLVEYPEASGSGFNYRTEIIDNIEYVVLENYKTIASSYSFDCSITWIAPKPSDIPGGFENTIKGNIKVDLDLDGKVDLESESNELSLKYNTNVSGESNRFSAYGITHEDRRLGTYTNVYTSWQSGWNTALKPENADDYVYSVWNTYGYVYYATQPYNISLNVIPNDELGGEVVGYCYGYNCYTNSGNNGLKSTSRLIEIPNPSSTYDYINDQGFIVKYPKANILDDQPHTLKEKVIYTINGIDGTTSTVEKDATSTFKGSPEQHDDEYLTPGFEPKREIKMSHSGGSSYSGVLNAIEQEGNENEFRIGDQTGWMNASNGTIIDLEDTLKDGGDPDNPADYFVNKWTYNNVVDTYAMGSGNDYELLSSGDYEIKQFYAYYYMYGYVDKVTVTQNAYNTVTIDGWQEEQLAYENYEPAKIYYKNNTGEWIYYVSIKKINSSYCDFTYANGTEKNNISCNDKMDLPSGAIGLKLSVETNQYKVVSNIYYYSYGKNSNHVKNIANNKDSLSIYTINTVYGEDKNNIVFTDFETPDNGNNLLSGFNNSVNNKDNAIYGKNMRHAFSSSSYTRVKSGYSGSNKWVNYINDPSNRRVIANYTAYAYEYATYSSSALTPEVIFSSGLIKEQKNGTFYDLLPKGVYVDVDTVVVQTFNTSKSYSDSSVNMFKEGTNVNYNVSIIDNWNKTGRTMMIVRASLPQEINKNYINVNNNIAYSGFSIKFTAYYSWDSIYDYGNTLNNTIAYKSGNGALTEGYADDATSFSSLNDKNLFVDLDKDGNPEGTIKDTVYAQRSMSFSFNTASDSSFELGVKTSAMTDYSNGKEENITVSAGGYYNYRLRYASQRNVKTTNLVLYDVLEDYKDGNEQTWKGKFVGIDVSQPESKNIDPIVYYSTKENINLYEKGKSVLDNGIPVDADLTNPNIWSTTPPENLADVTAIAVDLSNSKTGSDIAINPEESIVVGITMQAPYTNFENNISNSIMAQNASWWSGTTVQGTNNSHQNFSVYEWTKIGLKSPQISIVKKSHKESGTLLKPTTVAYGDKIIYDIVVGLDESYTVASNITIEDVLPDAVELDSDSIGYYKEGQGDFENYTLSASDDFTNVDINGKKVSISIKELLSTEKVHFIIPVYVKKALPNSPIDNVAKIVQYNNIDSDFESNHTYHTIDTGNIKITKKVKGIKSTDTFKIKIKISQSSNDVDEETLSKILNGTYSGIKFKDGEGYITLKSNESFIIKGLPINYKYEVIEDDYTQLGYSTTYKGSKGKIEPNISAQVEITNTWLENPDTAKILIPFSILFLLIFYIIVPFKKPKIFRV